MAERVVRIYGGEEDHNVIGFSMSVANTAHHPELARFLDRRGYDWRHTEEAPADGRSTTYIEVHPPLSAADTNALGKLLVGGVLEGEMATGIIDAHNDGARLVDNRIDPPGAKHTTKIAEAGNIRVILSESHGGGEIIAAG